MLTGQIFEFGRIIDVIYDSVYNLQYQTAKIDYER